MEVKDKTEKIRRRTTHVQNLLHVHSGDESFALFVELVEKLLVPVAQITESDGDFK